MTAFDERAFDALRRDADEISRVRQRAARLFKGCRPGAVDGLREVLQRVLPSDAEHREHFWPDFTLAVFPLLITVPSTVWVQMGQ